MLSLKFECRSYWTIKSKQTGNTFSKKIKKGVRITIKSKETSGKLDI